MKNWPIIFAMLFILPFPCEIQAAGQHDCEILEEIFNLQAETENGACKMEITRKNLEVTHMGIKLSPDMMEVGFHFSFEKIKDKTFMMGEMALLEKEVNPVIDELRKGKLEITAIHNHMLFEEPRMMYIHFQGIGNVEQQARSIKNAMDVTSK